MILLILNAGTKYHSIYSGEQFCVMAPQKDTAVKHINFTEGWIKGSVGVGISLVRQTTV